MKSAVCPISSGTISSAPAQPLHDNPFKPGRRPARSGCRPVFSPDPLNGTEAKDDFTFCQHPAEPAVAGLFYHFLVRRNAAILPPASPFPFLVKTTHNLRTTYFP